MDTSMADSFPSSPPNYSQDFALSGKIMLSAIIILLFVVILIVCLHIYARWYVLRARRRRGINNSRRRNRLVFFIDSENAAPHGPTIQNHGLDEAVLKSLPVFTYSSESYKDPIECAVCLSEFEENEKGRNLPKCSHSFHIECIDMWFHSHSTCPLCRSPVEPVVEPVVDFVVEPERCDVGPSSLSGSTSFRARRKPIIEIPTRGENEFVVAGAGVSSSSSPMPLTPSFKSPISRVMSLSFKRIIGLDRRGGGGLSPSGGAGSSAAELDIERGKESVM